PTCLSTALISLFSISRALGGLVILAFGFAFGFGIFRVLPSRPFRFSTSAFAEVDAFRARRIVSGLTPIFSSIATFERSGFSASAFAAALPAGTYTGREQHGSPLMVRSAPQFWQDAAKLVVGLGASILVLL